MYIPKELESYLGKILAFIGLLGLSVLALFILRIAITMLITPVFGEENAIKLVGAYFLTPASIIFNKYGIGLFSILLVGGIAVFSKNKR